MGEATPTPGRRRVRAGSGLFSSCPCSPPSAAAHAFLSRRPSSPVGIGRGHPFAVVHGSRGAADPVRSPSERSAGSLSPSVPPHEVPGFGAICSLVRLASSPSCRWCHGPSAGEPEPVAGGEPDVALGRPARGEPVDRREFFSSRVDPEGSEFPISPRSLPIEFPAVPGRWRAARKRRNS